MKDLEFDDRPSRVEHARKKVCKWQHKLQQLQDRCPHPEENLTKHSGANTGNYDPSADTYWEDCHCSNCDKHWTKYL